MVFSSTVFLCAFLPIVLILYYILPDKLKNSLLLIASLVFYAWGEPKYILLMLFTMAFDYFTALGMERSETKNAAKSKKFLLVLTVAVNIGMLCIFKYTGFTVKNINALFSSSLSVPDIALPIGISFYTFQTLSYAVDVYRGKVGAQHNFINFSMYISMFPQLIAGPIVRYSDIEKQIVSRPFDSRKFTDGIYRFIIGLGKKVLIANQIGSMWKDISALDGKLTASAAWLGAIAFAFQIYFDFSGYSDMAIGLGKMFGFDFNENFIYPYEANSITDFWRRWHISLSSWFKEYLYIPLGGNRKGTARQILNLFIVWALTGLWHGASWNFVLWGVYFFAILCLEKFLLKKRLEKAPEVLKHIYAVVLILIGWVIFANDSPAVLGAYFKSLIGLNGGFFSSLTLHYLRNYAAVLIISVIGATELPKKIAVHIKNEKASAALKLISGILIFALCICFILGDSYNPFLYFRF